MSATTGVQAEPTTEKDLAADDPVSPVTASDPDDTEISTAPRDDVDTATASASGSGASRRWRTSWSRVLGMGVLPAVAVLFAIAAGYFGWTGQTAIDSESARGAAVRAASESTVALLSY